MRGARSRPQPSSAAAAAAEHVHRKFKIPQYQNGQSYLTSHRVCYVDHDEPRKNSVAIFLKDVEKPEFYVRCTWLD
jgi:hypothetical protein